MDLCGYAASLARVFSAPALGRGCATRLRDREHFPKPEAVPPYNRPRKRRGAWPVVRLEQKERNWWHSGRRHAATVPVVGTGGWDRARVPPRAVLAVSG